MKYLNLALLMISGFILLAGHHADACSTIKLGSSTDFVSATNADFSPTCKKAIFLNRRGMWKTAAPLGSTGIQAHWFVKWGSVTSTFYGREFALGGMNEAGLIAQIQEDRGVYPEFDPKMPKLHIRQSVQYLLDTSSNISEAVENLSKVALQKGPRSVHWWMCEASGDCAVVEFVNTKLVIHRGKDLPITAITNSSYDDSLKVYKTCLAEGCEKNVSSLPNDPDSRFIKVSYLASQTKGTSPQDAFHILSAASQNTERVKTLWVYGYRQASASSKKEFYFAPETGAKPQWLNMAELDFSCKTAPQFQPITADSGAGNIAGHFQKYDKNFQKEMINALLANHLVNSEIAKEMIDYPDTVSHCD